MEVTKMEELPRNSAPQEESAGETGVPTDLEGTELGGTRYHAKAPAEVEEGAQAETFDMPDGGQMTTEDSDGDGDLESVSSDFDSDGDPEVTQYDADDDGTLESLEFDP